MRTDTVNVLRGPAGLPSIGIRPSATLSVMKKAARDGIISGFVISLGALGGAAVGAMVGAARRRGARQAPAPTTGSSTDPTAGATAMNARSHLIEKVRLAALASDDDVPAAIMDIRASWGVAQDAMHKAFLAADMHHPARARLHDLDRRPVSVSIDYAVTIDICADHALAAAGKATGGDNVDLLEQVTRKIVDVDERDRGLLVELLSHLEPGADRQRCMTSLVTRLKICLIDIAVWALHLSLSAADPADQRFLSLSWADEVTKALPPDWPPASEPAARA